MDNIGGVITMANMSSPGVAGKLFDCIWLVKPYMEHQYKAHLLVRIEQLTNLGNSARKPMKIHISLTSTCKLLPLRSSSS